MLNPPKPMLISPVNKRRDLEDEEHDIALETSQLLIRSPVGNECLNKSKRARYEQNWSFDSVCNHPCSPLSSIGLESMLSMSNTTPHFLPQDRVKQEHSPEREVLTHMPQEVHESSYLARQAQQYHNHHHHHHHVFSDNCHRQQPIYHSYHHEYHHYLSQPSYFSKPEHSEWFFGQSDFLDPYDSPPMPLSPSPPTTTNHSSSSSKSTCSHRTKLNKSKHKKDNLKDDPSDSSWGNLTDKEKIHNVAGESKSITLKDMCRKGLIREQDVIVYKRNFSASKVVVSKSMTVVKACGLSGISIRLDDEIFEDFETPTALETKILDHGGKVPKDKRPNGNAFKSIRLIRAGNDMGRLFDIRKDGDNKNDGFEDY